MQRCDFYLKFAYCKNEKKKAEGVLFVYCFSVLCRDMHHIWCWLTAAEHWTIKCTLVAHVFQWNICSHFYFKAAPLQSVKTEKLICLYLYSSNKDEGNQSVRAQVPSYRHLVLDLYDTPVSFHQYKLNAVYLHHFDLRKEIKNCTNMHTILHWCKHTHFSFWLTTQSQTFVIYCSVLNYCLQLWLNGICLFFTTYPTH